MMRCSLLLAAIFAGQLLCAQSSINSECQLSMNIPNRLMPISSSDKEVVYRDKKTNSILTFTKAGVTDYDFDLDFTAENVTNELSENPNYIDVGQERLEIADGQIIIVYWTLDKMAPNRRNNHNSLALMDLCGQYYTFRFTMPNSKKDDVNQIFNEILASIVVVG